METLSEGVNASEALGSIGALQNLQDRLNSIYGSLVNLRAPTLYRPWDLSEYLRSYIAILESIGILCNFEIVAIGFGIYRNT